MFSKVIKWFPFHINSCNRFFAKDDFQLCLAFSLSKNSKGSVDLKLKKMATKSEVAGSNPRPCKMCLKQRSKRASKILWPKRLFLQKKNIIIKFKARISQSISQLWFAFHN